jgi:hypothetical protein
MKVKDGANIDNLHPLARRAAEIAAERLEFFLGYENTVTSGNDGVHSTNSLHYQNRATDHRTWRSELCGLQIDMGAKKHIAHNIKSYIEMELGHVAKFDVIAEKTHIHVELDRILDS